MTYAEREFWISMRRQVIGIRGALDKWSRTTLRDSSDARFIQTFRAGLDQIVGAIEERCQVGEYEPKEKSLMGRYLNTTPSSHK